MQSVALLLLLAVPAFGASCEEGWHQFKGNCYKHFNNRQDRVDFKKAEERCVAKGAHLTTVSNQQEMNFIARISRIDNVFGWSGLPLVGIHRNLDGELAHIGNENIPVFTKWCKGEPNNFQLKENCVILRFDAVSAGGFMAGPGAPCMHDAFCAAGYEGIKGFARYVCKKAATGVDTTEAAVEAVELATAKPAAVAVEAVSVKAVEVAAETVSVKAVEVAAVKAESEKPAEKATEAPAKATTA